jgi:hypothetical protein
MDQSNEIEMLSGKPPVWHRAAPAMTLAVLAPVLAEVLSGSTRLSFIFVLIPEIMVWGVGALIVRDLVRRWKAGSTSLVLLALALAVAEEWVIQQTSLAPLPWVARQYGRLWGVNWVWFLFFLGYESVWVVLVPVQITELIFRRRREERWLSNGGLVASSLVFLLGSFLAWFLWTQIARPKTFHAPKYQPPITQPILGLMAIVILALAAYFLRHMGKMKHKRRWAPPTWVAAIAAFLLGIPWYALLFLTFGAKQAWPFWIPMIVGCIWAIWTWAIIAYWTASENWNDSRRLALSFGATIVIMICGFFGSHAWPKIDLIAKVLLDILAIWGLSLLASRLRPNRIE